MTTHKEEFIRHFAYDIYMKMPANFKKDLCKDKMFDGLFCESNDDCYVLLDCARFFYRRRNDLWSFYLGRLVRSIINRMDPIEIVREIENIDQELYEYYWYQLDSIKHGIIIYWHDISKYHIDNVPKIMYSYESINLENSRVVLNSYEQCNGIASCRSQVCVSYTSIANLIAYIWILTQIEYTEEASLQPELIEKLKEEIKNA